ncbi:glucosaminidase domain-containing protein [Aureispira anguillae]|uniref:Peptidoglycan hydrolase n=1 Tax=Aureispira anguillae TaxID=2864201 RepID=A0A915YIE7_9BACT|nr:glucosaminidase domain-containing protein [Aureispira anguillae]BDS13546.1 glucosaminidase domain-containing protein [Aureispira anguillae]
MQVYTHFIIALIAALPTLTLAQKGDKGDLTVDEYINTFKNIAIQEMERSGIPASITLAQGIHESAFGNSNLAKKANNHFGIKCTKDWEGKSMYKWDDEAQKSCFRVYTSADDSYVDHTDFLLNRRHYAFLFEYKRSDYKRWAKGLKKAGYATDPKYPDKLIHTIEKYKLAQYDKATGLLTYDTTRLKNPNTYVKSGKYRAKPRSFFFKSYKPGFFRTNGATYAISRKGESALAVAKRFGIPYKRFLKFNDLVDGDNLMDYQPVYIQPKRNAYKGEETFYKVEKDITMYEIAQEFGMKLSNLLTQNLLEVGEEPMNGELIMLKEMALSKPKLRAKSHIDTLPSPYVDDETVKKVKKQVVPTRVVIPKVERPKPQSVEVNTPTYDKAIYSDTARINTAKSKDKAFLNVVVNNTTTTTTGTNKTTNTVIRRPRNTPTNTGQNSSPKTNPNALFNPSTTTPTTDPNPKTTTGTVDKVERPVIKKEPIYPTDRIGSTKDYNSTVVVKKEDKKETPKQETFIYHVVQKGETLYRIHRQYGVSVEVIQVINKLQGTILDVGARLKIPVK